MTINSPKQLKDWISNMAKQNNLVANTVLQNYMMERFLERVSVSRYKDNFILKGGFLIAAMVGIDMRSTMDMDTTIKGIPVDRETIERIMNEILSIDIGDNVTFTIKSIKSIHDVSDYDDFRIGIEAKFFTMRVNMKIDITTGDVIIPREVSYSFKLMFEDRYIEVKAYNINTILSEKIETILSRNISNTRARDFYDVYILLTTRSSDINKDELKQAIIKKAEERNSIVYVENYKKYLTDVLESEDVQKIWDSYKNKYFYAKDILFSDIINCIEEVLK
jgi:predicted nucleotidyltransferase component of viral defense system